MKSFVFSPTQCCGRENCIVDDHAICKALGADAAADFDRYSHLHTFKRGQTIIGQGEDPILVGNIVSGMVKLTISTEDGDQQIVGLLYPSDFFGRVFSDRTRFSYEAATDVTLCAIDRRNFEQLLQKHPEVEHQLLVNTLDELDAARGWIALINNRTTMQRLAALMFILMRRMPEQIPTTRDGVFHNIIRLPISRKDIADLLGTTPETLSRNIQVLSRRGVIRILDSNRFELLGEAKLIKFAGDLEEDIEYLVGLTDRRPASPLNLETDLAIDRKTA